MADLDRFMAMVSPEPNTGCWLWLGSARPNGYGLFFLGGKTVGAHRAAWMLVRGPIPSGLFACHHCDVPACVNPAHLFLGTAKDNAADMDSKGRRVVAPHDGPNNPMHGRRHTADARSKQAAAKAGRYVGSAHPRATVNEHMVREIRARRLSGATATSIAADLGISFHVVRNVIGGKSWRHI